MVWGGGGSGTYQPQCSLSLILQEYLESVVWGGGGGGVVLVSQNDLYYRPSPDSRDSVRYRSLLVSKLCKFILSLWKNTDNNLLSTNNAFGNCYSWDLSDLRLLVSMALFSMVHQTGFTKVSMAMCVVCVCGNV